MTIGSFRRGARLQCNAMCRPPESRPVHTTSTAARAPDRTSAGLSRAVILRHDKRQYNVYGHYLIAVAVPELCREFSSHVRWSTGKAVAKRYNIVAVFPRHQVYQMG